MVATVRFNNRWTGRTLQFSGPFGGTITHDSMPPNTVVCRSVAWRLKTRAGTTVGKSQVYIWLCHTIGIRMGYRYRVLPNPATGHFLGHSHALVFLLGTPNEV